MPLPLRGLHVGRDDRTRPPHHVDEPKGQRVLPAEQPVPRNRDLHGGLVDLVVVDHLDHPDHQLHVLQPVMPLRNSPLQRLLRPRGPGRYVFDHAAGPVDT